MPVENSVSENREMDKIYNDTSFFIDAITSEYGFYNSFIKSVEDGKSTLSIKREQVKKMIETEWVSIIEATLPALDVAIRRPSVGIEEKEEILPIEFSRNITQKSLQHLAQHTDFISHIDDDGTIMPSKILNVYHDETLQTYENKFINTLIDRLFMFVDRRYSVIKERGTEELNIKMDFNSDFKFSTTMGKINFSIESSTPTGADQPDSMFQRVKRIYNILAQYKGSNFVKDMEGAMIHPPVMRTNAIRKNKYLGQCLDLWDFIEAYDKAGYSIEASATTQEANYEYIDRLYSLISLQYLVFTYNFNERFQSNKKILEENTTKEPIKPHYIRELEILNTNKFNMFDTEYKKIVNIFGGPSQHRLSPEEAKVRDAVAFAIKEDRRLEQLYKKAKKAKH